MYQEFGERVSGCLKTQLAQELVNEQIDTKEFSNLISKLNSTMPALATEVEEAFINLLTDVVHKLVTNMVEVKLSVIKNQE